MVNVDLRATPYFELSADVSLHWYESGDETSWLAIHEFADGYNEITPKQFGDQFSHDTLSLTRRQCYLCDKNANPIATATAWAETRGKWAGYGRPHWIAVLPEFQNRGIGMMLMSIICQRLIILGHTKAFLTTLTHRKAAIHLYEKFGFRIAETASNIPSALDNFGE